MTGLSPLQVTAHHLRELAGVQDEAARGIFAARTEVVDMGEKVEKTHGSVCSVMAEAVKAAESDRVNAAHLTQSQSEDLVAKLQSAADKYDAIDEQEKGALDDQMQPGG